MEKKITMKCSKDFPRLQSNLVSLSFAVRDHAFPRGEDADGRGELGLARPSLHLGTHRRVPRGDCDTLGYHSGSTGVQKPEEILQPELHGYRKPGWQVLLLFQSPSRQCARLPAVSLHGGLLPALPGKLFHSNFLMDRGVVFEVSK